MFAAARTYCDYNAGAPVRPEAEAALARALAEGGNPSSVHGPGRRARAAIEGARETLARCTGAFAADVVFTSGASEALHLAVEGAGADALVLSGVEHDALAEAYPRAQRLAVGSDGVVRLEALAGVLAAAGPRPLVALMLANNETGAIQPVAQAAALVHAAGGLLLCDAAQALGRIPVERAALGADYLVVSSHKLGGPPGAGALILAPGAPFTPPRRGGGQEQGRRPGTENTPAIAGFAAAIAAAHAAQTQEAQRLAGLRDRFEAMLLDAFPEAEIVARGAPRLPNTSLFALPGLKAEIGVIALDLAGVAVSSGAACSSGKVRPSRVLAAMGVEPALARSALRVSFGWASREEDGARVVAALRQAVKARAPQQEDAA